MDVRAELGSMIWSSKRVRLENLVTNERLKNESLESTAPNEELGEAS